MTSLFFAIWSKACYTVCEFATLVHDPDLEWEFIDSSIVKAHQHSAGATRIEEQGIGKSVAGNTTKIHIAADGYGLPIDFEITGGEVHDRWIPRLRAGSRRLGKQ